MISISGKLENQKRPVCFLLSRLLHDWLKGRPLATWRSKEDVCHLDGI